MGGWRKDEENYESGELLRKRKERTTECAEDAERKTGMNDTTNTLLAFCFSYHSVGPMPRFRFEPRKRVQLFSAPSVSSVVDNIFVVFLLFAPFAVEFILKGQ